MARDGSLIGLLEFEPAELFAPSLLRPFSDVALAPGLRCRPAVGNRHFDLPKHRHDLLRRVFPLRRTPGPSRISFH